MGHPDKVADQISDSILDTIIGQDSKCRVACETMLTTGMALVAGEITTTAKIDVPEVARNTIREIGYTDGAMGFDADSCAIIVAIDRQSPDISQGVTEGSGLHKEQGAGDQGLMFGYACDDDPEGLMPLPIQYSHKLIWGLAELRQKGELPYLRPDGKSQVTVEYDGDKPVRVHTVVVSTQHDEDVEHAQIKKDVVEKLIQARLPADMLDKDTIYHVNPTGRFVVGGPHGDTGLTGRKIIVDTYGGWARHGGGAFSGKDPSKVDRSASYMARHVAKNVVAAGLARRCEVQLAYAIGVPDPISVLVDTDGTHKVDEAKIEKIIRDTWDLRPRAIIEYLDLLKPIYTQTARYGHFGLNRPGYTWEETSKADELRKAAGV
jgi:S-adenosylmethionine synthetase